MCIGKAIQCNGRTARLAMQAGFDGEARGILRIQGRAPTGSPRSFARSSVGVAG